MATKTLGLKFEVKGFEQATSSLRKVKKEISLSLEHNKKLMKARLTMEKTFAHPEGQRLASSKKKRVKGELKHQKPAEENSRSGQNDCCHPCDPQEGVIDYKTQGEVFGLGISKALTIFEKVFLAKLQQVLSQDSEKKKKGGLLSWLIFKPLNNIIQGYFSSIGNILATRFFEKFFPSQSTLSRVATVAMVELTSKSIKEVIKGFSFANLHLLKERVDTVKKKKEKVSEAVRSSAPLKGLAAVRSGF